MQAAQGTMQAQSAAVASGVAEESRRSKAFCHTFRFVHRRGSGDGQGEVERQIHDRARREDQRGNAMRLEEAVH